MRRYTRGYTRLQYCIYRTFLREPRLYYHEGAKRCHVVRNTFTQYWEEGLENEVFFPPQIRLKMYKNRKEYIYLIQNDSAHELYQYYRERQNVVYLVFTSGKFDLLIQTTNPLEDVPDSVLLQGYRSNYFYPETPFYSFETALDKMEALLNRSHNPSKSIVTFPEEPKIEGSYYGWRIFPYVKYNLRVTYTSIIKELGISYPSFHKGFNYLLSVSTVLLPYYPFGFQQYAHHFFVVWTRYEDMVRKFFSLLPCHISITKVNDTLLIYASIKEGGRFKVRFFNLCYQMLELGLAERFWTTIPIHHWVPDI